MGGTSLLNALVYTRGSKHDFDEWEHLGATGWSYKDVLPYFKKSERILAEELQNSDVHGHDGYLSVDIRKHFELHEWFLQAGRDLGTAIHNHVRIYLCKAYCYRQISWLYF